MEKVRVRVSKTDIKYGLRSKACFCPIARAIKRKVKQSKNVVVVLNAIYVNKMYKEVSNPKKLFKWICDFDNKQPVEPFSFTLYL